MHKNGVRAFWVACLVALLSACAGDRRASVPRGAVGSGRTLSILAYNVFLRPHIVGLADKKKERLSTIVGAVLAHDVVGLSEAFDDDLRGQIRKAALTTHPFAVEPPADSGGIREDGGSFLLSRYPIEFAKTHVYEAAKGADSLSAKGVIYARVNLGAESVDFIVTHLQSGADYADVRERQLNELAHFAARFEDPAISQIVLGDLNVVEAKTAEYEAMLRSLAAPLDIYRRLNKDPGYTWDGVQNPLADNRNLERIDYILCRHCEGHEAWLKSSRVEPFPLKVPAGKARFGSDHFGVSAEIAVP